MYKKIYKRFPIKLWISECEMCCMECCIDVEECSDSCVKNEITCNQIGRASCRERVLRLV